MSLFLATLLPGLFLALLGATLLWNNSFVGSTAKALPRSTRGAWLFFGAGAGWFIWRCAQLNESDLIFFKTPGPVMIAFGVLAGLAFRYTPDFLAVRGLCVLMLLAAEPLLYAAYMEYGRPQRLLMVTAVWVRTIPSKCAVVPISTAPATCQKTFLAMAPPVRNTFLAELMVRSPEIWKIQTSVALPVSVTSVGMVTVLVHL